MEYRTLFNTVYVFKNNENVSILKKKPDGSLSIETCSIDTEELRCYIETAGYNIS